MTPSAKIFDVKHFAVHDGPGIRTTFFLMGCPLRCLWCQNPESQKEEPIITFTRMRCIGCGHCVSACGRLDSGLQLPRSQCTLCGDCVRACPSGAKKYGSTAYTPEQILETILPEKPFFDASDHGGVTFSGGECLTHPVFVAESFRLLKEHGIHTTADTCGAVPWENLKRVLPFTDLFLYDIKKIDGALHRAYTGMDSRLILDNLEQLCAAHANVLIRVPLIPGYTDSPEDMHAIGRFIRDRLSNNIIRCELLPYNKLAASKYGNKTIWTDYTLGDYALPELEPQSKETLSLLAGILESYGVKVFAESF